MVLGKRPVPGRPTNFDNSEARAYCACSRYGRGWFGHFFLLSIILSSFSLSLGDGPIWTETQELDVVLFTEVVPTIYNNRRTDTSKQSRSFSGEYHDNLLVFNYVLMLFR